MNNVIKNVTNSTKKQILFPVFTILVTGMMAGIGGIGQAAASKTVTTAGKTDANIQLGPRPFYLVDQLPDGELKEKLQNCKAPYSRSDFSIGHRGAAMQFPEHTRESYVAAARTGAGILECDVTFTKDRELVCRHSQCDLHTTTNILSIPELAAKCSVPFEPAQFDKDGKLVEKAKAKCCTSDLTLNEFKRLRGKMDAYNPEAKTAEEYMGGTAAWRTDLYSTTESGTLMTHAESIDLFKELGVGFTPELKSPSVEMPFEGEYSQEDYASQMIEEYEKADVDPARVWVQSFHGADIEHWIKKHPKFGKQAVYLDGRYDIKSFDFRKPSTYKPSMKELADKGVQIIAPPLWMLVDSKDGKIVPSAYAKEAKKAGLDIITWTLERSGPLQSGGGWYYQSIKDITSSDAQTYQLLDVLAQEVGVLGVFSDWPATTSLYASCMLDKKH